MVKTMVLIIFLIKETLLFDQYLPQFYDEVPWPSCIYRIKFYISFAPFGWPLLYIVRHMSILQPILISNQSQPLYPLMSTARKLLQWDDGGLF